MTLRLARLVRAFALSCLLAAVPGQAFARCQTTSDCLGAIQEAHRDLSTLTARPPIGVIAPSEPSPEMDST